MTHPVLRCLRLNDDQARVVIELDSCFYPTSVVGPQEQIQELVETGALPLGGGAFQGPEGLPALECVNFEPDVEDAGKPPHSLLLKILGSEDVPCIYLRLAVGARLGEDALKRVRDRLLTAPRKAAEQAQDLQKQLSEIRHEVRSNPGALKKVRTELQNAAGSPDVVLRIKHDLAEGWASREREAVLVQCLTQELGEEIQESEPGVRESGVAAAARILRKYRAGMALVGIEQGEITPDRVRAVISNLDEEQMEAACGPLVEGIRNRLEGLLSQTAEMGAEMAKLLQFIVEETSGAIDGESSVECVVRMIREMQASAGSSMGFQVVGLGSGEEEVGDLPEALLLQWADEGPPKFYVKSPEQPAGLERVDRIDASRGRAHVEAAQRIARDPNAIPRGDTQEEDVKVGFQEEWSDEFTDADGKPVPAPKPQTKDSR